jgi:tetratricopeptide (TPR) repeat protein
VRRARQRAVRVAALGLALGLGLGPSLGGCTDGGEEPVEAAPLDTRLETHAVVPGEPTAEGLAYVQAVAEAHRMADRLSDRAAALDVLLTAVELTPPPGDGAAELLHYELLARTAELLLASRDSEEVVELLAPRLAPERSLPRDRAAARCLVALGDAAAHTGDHALAMGSYARALELLTLLLEEVET